jgi:excisionase family DNA binding protein
MKFDTIIISILLTYGVEEKKMNKIIDEKWINTDEAAEYLGVRPATIREWIKKRNGIPAHKMGKFWKFKKSELDGWVNSEKIAD